MTALGNAFLRYKVVITESNSSDDTLYMLNKWAENDDNVHIIDAGNLTHASRTVRIATCRNMSIKFLEDEYTTYDFMIMMDGM